MGPNYQQIKLKPGKEDEVPPLAERRSAYLRGYCDEHIPRQQYSDSIQQNDHIHYSELNILVGAANILTLS